MGRQSCSLTSLERVLLTSGESLKAVMLGERYGVHFVIYQMKVKSGGKTMVDCLFFRPVFRELAYVQKVSFTEIAFKVFFFSKIVKSLTMSRYYCMSYLSTGKKLDNIDLRQNRN